MTKALYNKWRPQKWDEVVGQQHVVQTLQNAVIGNHLVQAYLFSGPRGTGKTTVARLLAKAVNCVAEDLKTHPCNQCDNCKAVNENRFLDLIEIDAASNNSVDNIRDLREKVILSTNKGKYKIYIIDEAHMLSGSAFNALLKTLEEPPAHAIFILATTEMHKIPATIISRCQHHDFRRVPVDDIVGKLKEITASENLNAEPGALTFIARQSAGGMRDAISLLDQMASTGKEITLSLIQSILGTAPSQIVIDLVSAVVKPDPAVGMNAIHTALDSGTDPRFLARQVVGYLRAVLLIKMGNSAQADLPMEISQQARIHAGSLTPTKIMRMIKAFDTAAFDQRGWQPSLPLEMALAESLELQPVLFQQASPDSPPKPPVKEKIEKTVGSPVAPQVVEKVQPAPVAQKDSSVTLGMISKSWKEIVVKVKSNMSLGALLNSCKLLELKNDTLTLGFSSDILQAKAGTSEHLEAISKAIADVLQVNLSIKCVVSNAKQATPADLKADGMVAAALKKGGEIVDIQE